MPLRLPGWPHMPDDHVSRPQFIPAQLRLGYINILRANAVILPEKTDPLIHNFKNPTANFQTFRFTHGAGDLQDQTLSLISGGSGDF